MTAMDPNGRSASIPTVPTSEAKIKEDAKDALAYLKRLGAIDLHQVLGLTLYLESEK